MVVLTHSLPRKVLTTIVLQLFICQVLTANFSFIGSDTCNRPFSLDSNFSVLRWPFSSGNWMVRNNWKGANEPGGEGSGWGQGRHFGSHFYAVDWNKVGSNDCDSIFHAPMGGTVIYSFWTCSPGCVATGENCRGNEVVIQSNVDTNYAFSVLHLNMVWVPVGRIVKVGDPLGTIGSTGFSPSSHAHCVLFKKINRYLTGITIGLQLPDEHAAPFDFSADCGGDGPHNINLDVITAIIDLPSPSLEKYFRIIHARADISITAINDPLKKFSVQLYNSVGQKLFENKFTGIGNIYLTTAMKGICFLLIQSGSNRFNKKIHINN
jgi:hypothetical protein